MNIANIYKNPVAGKKENNKLFFQPKLTINTPNDIYEQEADAMADKVMRMPANDQAFFSPKPLSVSSVQRKCKHCEEEEKLQRKDNNSTAVRANASIEGYVGSLNGKGKPLTMEERTFFEPRFGYDFSVVQLHTNNEANLSAKSINSLAYTHGNHIVFGSDQYQPNTDSGRKLISHELTHVVQQSGSDVKIQRTSIADQVVTEINRPDPIAGIGDFSAAFNLLNGLSMTDMLDTLSDVADQGLLDVLESNAGTRLSVDMPRIMATLFLIKFSKHDASTISQADINTFNANASSLPPDQQSEMLRYIQQARRLSQNAREGLEALIESSHGNSAGLIPNVVAGATVSVNPGPWNPPGNQPIPYYIGNEAHVGIAANYVIHHTGDVVFSNFTPMSSLLQSLIGMGQTPNASALSSSQLGLKPDITNLSRLHLYEIKPLSSQAVAATEAAMYMGLFVSAGIPVTLGPTAEPGTSGIIPAPGGIYIFKSTLPGVIVYQYRPQRLVPVPVTSPSTESETETSSARFRFQLAPLTPQQQVAVATTAVGGTMLIILMIILSPVGA